ncbi:MAG TPA: glycosyltransferase [Bryobacteraceae bacterium]|jgi:UDP-glucose:tetrahydrobiopterin glucosyltransferase
MNAPRRILFVAPPIAPIGDGIGGGVETSLLQLTRGLASRGHRVGTIAVAGSRGLAGELYEFSGRRPLSVTHRSPDHVDSVDYGGTLERMWDRVASLQAEFDVVLNTGYDWLSFYLTPFLRLPVLHWISLCPMLESVDRMIEIRYRQCPSRFAFYSHTQAAAFPFVHADTAKVLYGGVDTSVFEFVPQPERRLCWSARISPEKGLEDALEVSSQLGLPLDVCGRIEDQNYWESLQGRLDPGSVSYRGFLSPAELSKVIGRSQAMLVTPKWNEAFGVSLIEAMSCGTPVVAYREGGPSEIVEQGESGFLVERGDVAALAACALRATELDRHRVRQRAAQFGIDALADRVEQWIATAA